MNDLAAEPSRSGLAWVFLVHALLVLRLLSLPDLVSGRPFGAIDYQNHYYEAVHARERFHRDGSVLGYDPYWMVGYPEGLFGWVENRFFYLALTLSPAGYEAIVFNASIVVLLMTIPLGIFIAAAVRLPLAASAAIVGLFALFHGYAHGAEMSGTVSGFTYEIGFVTATASLHLSGLSFGLMAQRINSARLIRYAGGAIAACGLYFCFA